MYKFHENTLVEIDPFASLTYLLAGDTRRFLQSECYLSDTDMHLLDAFAETADSIADWVAERRVNHRGFQLTPPMP